MSLPRPLTEEERRLVRWMIEHRESARQEHLSQLEKAIVVAECPCGCASIDFQIGDTPPNFKAGMQILADYLYCREDESFGAFLFACEGILGGLEVYSFTDRPAPLPAPEDLRPLERAQTEPSSSPNGDPARRDGNSGAMEGPPSVS